MTYKVTYVSPYNFSVKSSQPINPKVSIEYNLEMPQSLNELTDVELSGNNYDQYVLVYDATSGKWRDRNPDEVLSAATLQPDADRTTYTLPTEFENKLDVDLDDRINLDAGTF
jgi:hypothetical protein